MKEKTLFKIAIVSSVIGLIVLFFISESLEYRDFDFEEITKENIGDEVKIIGKVIRVTDKDKVMFLTIAKEDIDYVDVVLFKEKNIQLKEGDYVELVGKLDEYKGEINIVANAVKLR